MPHLANVKSSNKSSFRINTYLPLSLNIFLLLSIDTNQNLYKNDGFDIKLNIRVQI